MQTTTAQCTAALNTALQVAVKHNLESTASSNSRRKPSALSEIKINQPGYQNDGAVILSWKDANLPGTVKKYEFEFLNVESHIVCTNVSLMPTTTNIDQSRQRSFLFRHTELRLELRVQSATLPVIGVQK